MDEEQEIIDDLPIEDESMDEFVALVEVEPVQDIVTDMDGNVLNIDGTDEINDGDTIADGGDDEAAPVDDDPEEQQAQYDDGEDDDPLAITVEE